MNTKMNTKLNTEITEKKMRMVTPKKFIQIENEWVCVDRIKRIKIEHFCSK